MDICDSIYLLWRARPPHRCTMRYSSWPIVSGERVTEQCVDKCYTVDMKDDDEDLTGI